MSEKPKNKPSRQNKWVIGCGIILLIAVAGVSLFIVVIGNAISATTSRGRFYELRGEAVRDFFSEYSFPLPDDADDLYVYRSYLDFSAYLRFSASPQSVEAWLNGNDFCFTELIENEPAYLFRDEPNLSWWQANTATRYAVAHQCGTNPYYELVIDQSNPELWIVYLIIFTT
jgi:hypothetical protein